MHVYLICFVRSNRRSISNEFGNKTVNLDLPITPDYIRQLEHEEGQPLLHEEVTVISVFKYE